MSNINQVKFSDSFIKYPISAPAKGPDTNALGFAEVFYNKQDRIFAALTVVLEADQIRRHQAYQYLPALTQPVCVCCARFQAGGGQ